MNVAIITGSGGLTGSEAVAFFSPHFDLVIGIDNNLRRYFFGEAGSVSATIERLKVEISNYNHFDIDIRSLEQLDKLFSDYGADVKMVLHTAAQPSHDWAAREPFTDFTVNANGTLNLLEMTRKYCPEAVFIYTSTNKVYGEHPNQLSLVEQESRWELPESDSTFNYGIDESMSLDQSRHSLMGVSKLSADIMVQEYGKYFGLKTGIFRCGCISGPGQAGVELHGFLSYLVHSAINQKTYTIFGYKGKQVRDNIHSFDLVNMFWHFYQNPRNGEVYNVGGGRHSNCSILEAITLIKKISSHQLKYSIQKENRTGDHKWYISDVRKFRSHFPDWDYKYSLEDILVEML